MRLFVSSNHPISQSSLIAICKGVNIVPLKYQIFSHFRAFLDFENAQIALNALDSLNQYLHCQDQSQYDLRVLPAIPTSISRLQSVILINYKKSSFQLYSDFLLTKGFAGAYVFQNRGFILFQNIKDAQKVVDQQQGTYFRTFNIAMFMEQDIKLRQIKIFSSQFNVNDIIKDLDVVKLQQNNTQLLYFLKKEDLQNVVIILEKQEIKFVCQNIYQQERSCQIYNLKISITHEDLLDKLEQIGTVKKITFPPFLFVENVKFHVNVLFADEQSRINCQQWFSLLASEMAQDGTSLIIL